MATTFRSIHHPAGTPRGVVYTRFLARPLGACTIPLMIGATTSALLEQPVWGYLVWGLPAAIGLATVWTHFSMSRTIAEIAIRPGQAAVRSVYDVLRRRPYDWETIYTVRSTSWNTELSVGRTTYEFTPQNWPKYEQLQKRARQAFQLEASPSAPS